MSFVTKYINDFFDILIEMSPYLLLGFLFAGILHVLFSKEKINRFLGKKNFKSVINASLLGVPLPLCSCGVIPTGVSFYKHGASKGSSVSFLISTPQTGVDSIFVTYSLLGLPFAIIRPVVALVTGVLGGFLTNKLDKKSSVDKAENLSGNANKTQEKSRHKNTFVEIFRYAFVEFLNDISKWLIIGLLIAAAISVIVPDDFFATYISNDYLDMLIILIASIPLYVCATASVPIAAILLLKGLSPGAALVFLMAGPATNIATMTVINKVMGKKTLFAYLFSIIIGALFFGVLINNFLPHDLFIISGISEHAGAHNHEILPYWLKVGSGIILLLFIVNGYIQKHLSNKSQIENIKFSEDKKGAVKDTIIKIKGMTCSHCKTNVEKSLKALDGIEDVVVDLGHSQAIVKGNKINLENIRETIQRIGYEYLGEVTQS